MSRSPTAGNAGNGGKWLHPPTRLRIYARDGHRCIWCRRSPGAHGVALSVDHFLPRALGGSNEPGNLLTACTECNSRRGHAPALTWCSERFGWLWGGAAEVLDRALDALERPLPLYVP